MGALSGPVVVEAYVNSEGYVYDYRIVSGPTDAATRNQVENLLVLSKFAPARFFGQPVRGWRCSPSPAYRCVDKISG